MDGSRGFLKIAKDLEHSRLRIEASLAAEQEATKESERARDWMDENLHVLKEWAVSIRKHPLPTRYTRKPPEAAAFWRRTRRAVLSHPEYRRLDREADRMEAELERRRKEAEGSNWPFILVLGLLFLALVLIVALFWNAGR